MFLNGQQVTIIANEGRGQCWVETSDGRLIKVYRRGLTVTAGATTNACRLSVDTSRGTDGAR